MRNLQVNGERLWASLMELAQIGATPKGGVCRLAASDLDGEARRLFIRWCEEAGCTVTVDQIGNIFARRPGRNPSLPPVMTGSHLDTQPTGGKFDGAYGVMAGLEVVRTLNDLGYETEAPIEIVAWTNEEGSRFSPAMVGSGVFAGVFELDEGLATARQRRPASPSAPSSSASALPARSRSAAGRSPPISRRISSRGRSSKPPGKPIGVVTGAQGQRWYEITVTGQEAHAGPTPMPRRARRAGRRRADDRRGQPHRPRARALCLRHGRLCPGQPQFAQHDPRPGVLHRRFPPSRGRGADRDGPRAARRPAPTPPRSAGLEAEVKEFWYFPPTPFDAGSRRRGARAPPRRRAIPHQDIISGAGHDAVYMARVAPTAMIFVPCVGGISHNEIEDAKPEDLTAGCNVLLNAVLAAAGG